MELSKLILVSLVQNQTFTKKVAPYLKKEYFNNSEERYLFLKIKNYLKKYKSFPSESAIKIEINDSSDLSQQQLESVLALVTYIYDYDIDYDDVWIIDKTEYWCKEQAIYNALLKSVQLHEEKKNLDSIPEILREALKVSFDYSCGIEVFDEKSILERLKSYKQTVKKYATGLIELDIVTDGGFEKKSLSVLFGGTNTGKSAALVAIAANMARNGEDVLYITLEMSEEKISQRFEANFLNKTINSIKDIEENSFVDGLNKIKQKSVGRIVIKEFPTATINTEHIRAFIDELHIKRNFIPTVLVIDYINLMRSSRFSGDNMYSTVKSITEEIRGIAIDKELCAISATQANKEGNNSKISDMDLTNVGESKALADSVDFLVALIFPEELREKNIQIWKVLKNRFGGSVNYKFPVTVDHAKSKILDCDDIGLIGGNTEPEKQNPIKKNKSVSVKFKEEQLDENLWDD